jgi:hypothetical protein
MSFATVPHIGIKIPSSFYIIRSLDSLSILSRNGMATSASAERVLIFGFEERMT